MISFAGVEVIVPSGEGSRTLLHRFDLDLAERRIALVGANGSGKSTLLRLMNGLVRPTQGTVTVAGFDTVRAGRKVRQRVGFVFTDPLAQLVMPTPVEDVELSLRRSVRDRRQRTARALELLSERGLEHVARSSIYDLSGGERQLVALTSVLAVEPEVVVADEPTTLLDLRNRIRFREVLAALPQQVVYATHDLELAAEADRVLVVDQGRVVGDGPPEPALQHYRELAAAER